MMQQFKMQFCNVHMNSQYKLLTLVSFHLFSLLNDLLNDKSFSFSLYFKHIMQSKQQGKKRILNSAK